MKLVDFCGFCTPTALSLSLSLWSIRLHSVEQPRVKTRHTHERTNCTALFHRRTPICALLCASYVYNGCLAWCNLSRIHSSVKYRCKLYHSRQLYNIHLTNELCRTNRQSHYLITWVLRGSLHHSGQRCKALESACQYDCLLECFEKPNLRTFCACYLY